ncbi:MAG: hypothetical protein ACYC10_20255 [Allorhizobium sp.]
MIRISISDVLLNGLNKSGRSAIIRFADGSSATALCLDAGEVIINYAGTRTVATVVANRNRKGDRFYFWDAENRRRVSHLYFVDGVGWRSRIAADLVYESENRLREHRIPRIQSRERLRFAVEVMR